MTAIAEWVNCDFYLALQRDRELALKSAAPREALRELMAEIDNVRAAWAWAICGEAAGDSSEANLVKPT